jgi:hypothetical protein
MSTLEVAELSPEALPGNIIGCKSSQRGRLGSAVGWTQPGRGRAAEAQNKMEPCSARNMHVQPAPSPMSYLRTELVHICMS